MGGPIWNLAFKSKEILYILPGCSSQIAWPQDPKELWLGCVLAIDIHVMNIKIENILKYHYHWYKLKVKVNKNNKWAILTNENISDFIYDDILKIDYYNDDILKVRINNKWGLYSCGDYFASNDEYKEISEIIYDDIVYEKSEQIGINDYEIHQLRGLKNGSWVILNKTKYVHKTAGSKVFDKLFGNFLRDFGK